MPKAVTLNFPDWMAEEEIEERVRRTLYPKLTISQQQKSGSQVELESKRLNDLGERVDSLVEQLRTLQALLPNMEAMRAKVDEIEGGEVSKVELGQVKMRTTKISDGLKLRDARIADLQAQVSELQKEMRSASSTSSEA